MRRLIIAILCLLSLTACSHAPLVKTEYIRPEVPAIPAMPQMYDVRFQASGGCYCLDEDNAKNLLKNILLLQAHDTAVTGILESLKKELSR